MHVMWHARILQGMSTNDMRLHHVLQKQRWNVCISQEKSSNIMMHQKSQHERTWYVRIRQVISSNDMQDQRRPSIISLVVCTSAGLLPLWFESIVQETSTLAYMHCKETSSKRRQQRLRPAHISCCMSTSIWRHRSRTTYIS